MASHYTPLESRDLRRGRVSYNTLTTLDSLRPFGRSSLLRQTARPCTTLATLYFTRLLATRKLNYAQPRAPLLASEKQLLTKPIVSRTFTRQHGIATRPAPDARDHVFVRNRTKQLGNAHLNTTLILQY